MFEVRDARTNMGCWVPALTQRGSSLTGFLICVAFPHLAFLKSFFFPTLTMVLSSVKISCYTLLFFAGTDRLCSLREAKSFDIGPEFWALNTLWTVPLPSPAVLPSEFLGFTHSLLYYEYSSSLSGTWILCVLFSMWLSTSWIKLIFTINIHSPKTYYIIASTYVFFRHKYWQ